MLESFATFSSKCFQSALFLSAPKSPQLQGEDFPALIHEDCFTSSENQIPLCLLRPPYFDLQLTADMDFPGVFHW